MPRRPSLEERLKGVRAVDPAAPDAHGLLTEALGDRSAFVVAAAAEVIGDAQLDGFGEALAGTFDRLLADGDEADPGCRAKAALVRALLQVDHHDAHVYKRGVRHVQLEPVFGGRQDVAGPLRGQSALGLVRLQHADAPLELAALLADPVTSARAAAAQVLGEIDPAVAVPLLRFKVLEGDSEIAVIGACLSALLFAAREVSIPFVAAQIEKSPAIAEAAAMALGESRLPAAFEPLAELTAKGPAEVRAIGFLALALLRTDRAWGHLLEVVATGSFVDARDAATALATFRHDAKLVERLHAAAARNNRRVVKVVEKALASEGTTRD